MAELSKIADDLSKLTIIEASELIKMLEEKWGVSAAAAAMDKQHQPACVRGQYKITVKPGIAAGDADFARCRGRPGKIHGGLQHKGSATL